MWAHCPDLRAVATVLVWHRSFGSDRLLANVYGRGWTGTRYGIPGLGQRVLVGAAGEVGHVRGAMQGRAAGALSRGVRAVVAWVVLALLAVGSPGVASA